MKKIYLFDWADTIMKDFPAEHGAMYAWRKVQMMPFADKMLQVLSQRADCYLATNAKDSAKEDIIKALKRVALHEYFKDIFCYQDLGFCKPAKEYFDLIMKKLDEKKENIIMIGDNIETDVYGVQNIGIDAILYDPDNKHPYYNGPKISNLLMILDYANKIQPLK